MADNKRCKIERIIRLEKGTWEHMSLGMSCSCVLRVTQIGGKMHQQLKQLDPKHIEVYRGIVG